MTGKLWKDERVDYSTTHFKCETYFDVMDTIITQINERFHDLSNTVNTEEAVVEYETFKDVYASISPSLTTDLQMKDVLQFLIKKQMAPGLPNLSIVYKIYLTPPVTSANAERSFSKLKIIKSYLRSTMTNEHLSGLALISIERELAEGIDFNFSINRFALMKSRRKKFRLSEK
ncbi:uncharacterized protein LOC136074462 [Hydra vulgaris]|uniref:Uncharacterized protein LOC136074462 n=1 Tax=Hydra vulgaris TaxID=6087 RepID=A0ABM4B226_HYDVU